MNLERVENMNKRYSFETPMFFEEQLFEAKNALFSARSVREVRFLQNRINYLNQRLKEFNRKKS